MRWILDVRILVRGLPAWGQGLGWARPARRIAMGDHEDPAASDMPPASRAANVEPAVEYVSIDDQIPSVVGDLISAVGPRLRGAA